MESGTPSGTVTFLFTDVEGSSRLWEEQPAAMNVALARHDEVLKGAIHGRRGVVFSTGGDGVAAVFARAADAVEAAIDAQLAFEAERWPEGATLRVRMALHTGESEERGGDYFGTEVNRAARLMALARGGQVLVSLATAEVARRHLREDAALVDLGQHTLRSLAAPERVFELTWPGHEPVNVVHDPAAVGNLPRETRGLIGRDADVAAIAALVVDAPLVTLVGVGGVGKTSLSLAVARAVADTFTDGVWFCELAGVLDSTQVAQALVEIMGVRPEAGVSQDQVLLRALAEQQCLLVLDNCEHILDAVRALANDVVAGCGGVRLLATSREPLGVPGERLAPVSPLGAAAAARLFAARLEEQGGAFGGVRGDVLDRDAVTELCGRLDGLPLAIELAAARARTMPLGELTERLAERFRLLRAGRGRTGRHQALEATVAWSYDLLDAAEQLLFDRLSVFVGGFELRAAEAVMADDQLDEADVVDLVGSLTDKSMVTAEPRGRYALLETLRQFGAGRLTARGPTELLRRRHAAHYAELAIAAHDGLQGPDQLAWIGRLEADWPNVRAAFEWAVASVDLDVAATIATHLMWAASWHDFGEPFLWVNTVATMRSVDRHPLWPSVLACRAWAAWQRGEPDAALALGLQSVEAEPRGRPAIDQLAHLAIYSAACIDEPELADEYLRQATERAHAAGHLTLEALHLTSYANIQLWRRPEEALVDARSARRTAELSGNPQGLSWALGTEGMALALLHDPTAVDVLQRALKLAQENGSTVAALTPQRELTVILDRLGHLETAAAMLLGGLQGLRRKGSWMYAGQALLYAARLMSRAGEPESAALLYGAVRNSSILMGYFARFSDSLRSHLERSIGVDRFEDLAASGEAMPIERAVALAEHALAGLAGSQPAS